MFSDIIKSFTVNNAETISKKSNDFYVENCTLSSNLLHLRESVIKLSSFLLKEDVNDPQLDETFNRTINQTKSMYTDYVKIIDNILTNGKLQERVQKLIDYSVRTNKDLSTIKVKAEENINNYFDIIEDLGAKIEVFKKEVENISQNPLSVLKNDYTSPYSVYSEDIITSQFKNVKNVNVNIQNIKTYIEWILPFVNDYKKFGELFDKVIEILKKTFLEKEEYYKRAYCFIYFYNISINMIYANIYKLLTSINSVITQLENTLSEKGR